MNNKHKPVRYSLFFNLIEKGLVNDLVSWSVSNLIYHSVDISIQESVRYSVYWPVKNLIKEKL